MANAKIFISGVQQHGDLDLYMWGGDGISEQLIEDQAKCVEKHWKATLKTFSKHGLNRQVKHTKPKEDKKGRICSTVYLVGERRNGDGSRGGKKLKIRNAEIAWLNEYGTGTFKALRRDGEAGSLEETRRVPRRLWHRAALAAAEPELDQITKKYLGKGGDALTWEYGWADYNDNDNDE